MRTSESIAVAYFVYLILTALIVRPPSGRRRRVIGAAALAGIAGVGLGRLGESGAASTFRDWIPVACLLVAYWLPAQLVTAPDERLERALLGQDYRWLGRLRLLAFAERGPYVLVELLELAYLFCYPLIPTGLACLYLAGLEAAADRFWTTVLVSVLPAYGALPWLPTRPPRMLEGRPDRPRSRARRLNLALLERGSVGLNTCPSGHAAAAVATALAVGAHSPGAGLLLGLIALGILAGSVTGRYHYTADAVSGAALGVAGFLVARTVPL